MSVRNCLRTRSILIKHITTIMKPFISYLLNNILQLNKTKLSTTIFIKLCFQFHSSVHHPFSFLRNWYVIPFFGFLKIIKVSWNQYQIGSSMRTYQIYFFFSLTAGNCTLALTLVAVTVTPKVPVYGGGMPQEPPFAMPVVFT